MPNPGDGPAVPPPARHRLPGGMHVARRPAAGRHRAEGLAGPTRRYTVIVIMLVTMASLPVLAAISAGSATIGSTADSGGTTPFIALPSTGPVVVPPPTALTPEPALPAVEPVSARARPAVRTRPDYREPLPDHPARPTESAPAPPPAPPAPPSPSPTPPSKPPETRPPTWVPPWPTRPPVPTPRPTWPTRPPTPTWPAWPTVSPPCPPTPQLSSLLPERPGSPNGDLPQSVGGRR